MTEEDATTPSERIDGLPVEEAVEAVLARDESGDSDEVRAALGLVADDGVVSESAVDDELGEASMRVSTAETRTELAGIELEDAREAASSVSDVDAVASRLDGFAARLDVVETSADALGDDLRSLIDRHEDADLVETATGLRELRAGAERVRSAADELQVDVEEFGRWVTTPEVRYREFEADLDAVGDWLDDLDAAVDLLAAGDDPPGDVDRATVWFDAALHRRLLDLLLADLRAELADLRALAGREDAGEADEVAHEERLGGFEADLDEVADRLDDRKDRLDDLARPAWRERFDDRLDDFDAALADHEPPVDWADLGATFGRHRPAGENAD